MKKRILASDESREFVFQGRRKVPKETFSMNRQLLSNYIEHLASFPAMVFQHFFPSLASSQSFLFLMANGLVIKKEKALLYVFFPTPFPSAHFLNEIFG